MNQVERAYNGLGQMTDEWQAVSGAVSTSTTPEVKYGYSFDPSGTANNSRQTSITYPNGREVDDDYAAGLDDAISRLSSLTDKSPVVTLEAYSYLGLGTIVERSHPQPGVDLTYVKQSGEADGDAGDQYTGLDRFGRVVDQRWIDTATGAATDRFQYGYDRDSNSTYRDNLMNSAFGEVYSYDGLNQVASFQRGTLNGTKDGVTGTASRSQSWDYDAAGNFDSVTTDGTAQARTANAQNEVTSISGATTPTFDAAGNMTGDEAGRQFAYDAWNRLVAVKDSSGVTLETFSYDGLNRRVSQAAGGTTTDLYYSSQWQVLEERVGGVATAQYVWSPAYVDALIERDRDTNGDGTLDERVYAQQDADWNTTALVSSSGSVVERYAYDPFGAATVYSPTYSALPGSGYGWVYLYQGRPLDGVSGTYDFRVRQVSPTLGRPIQADPLGLAPDANDYRWEGNGPNNLIDPYGLQGLPPSCPSKSQLLQQYQQSSPPPALHVPPPGMTAVSPAEAETRRRWAREAEERARFELQMRAFLAQSQAQSNLGARIDWGAIERLRRLQMREEAERLSRMSEEERIAEFLMKQALYTLVGAGLGSISRSLVRPSSPFGHAWEVMSESERRAFMHAHSRHGGELGLPNWAETNAETLRLRFNEAASYIRTNPTNIRFGRMPVGIKGGGVPAVPERVIIFEYTAPNGQTFYYMETLDGRFVSAGLSTP